MTTKLNNLSQRYIKAKGEDRKEIFYDHGYGERNYQDDKGQIVEIGEYCSVAKYNMDKIIETDQGIIRTIEVTLEEEI